MGYIFWGGSEGWSVKIYSEEKDGKTIFVRKLEGTLNEEGEPAPQFFRTDSLEKIWDEWTFSIPRKYINPIFIQEQYKQYFTEFNK